MTIPPSEPPVDRAYHLLEQEARRSRLFPTAWLIPFALLILTVLFFVLSRGESGGNARYRGSVQTFSNLEAPGMVALPLSIGNRPRFLVVRQGVDGTNDLFHCIEAACTNLTQSPSVTELWPVLDTTGTHVAYYGTGQAVTELFLLNLVTDTLPTVLPLTLRAGDSGLHTTHEITTTFAPAFSPDGQWVAFPTVATHGTAIELFAARADGSQVVRATDLSQQVTDYLWLDDITLLFAIRRSDETLEYQKAVWNGVEFETMVVEPLWQ